MVEASIAHIAGNGLLPNDISVARVADQGCGKLRHLSLLVQHFNEIYLVDTEFQLKRAQRIFGQMSTVNGYVDNLGKENGRIRSITDSEFAVANLKLDIVFNICVFDAEVPKVRKSMLASACQNLRLGGLFVLIIPRNDQSILKRCTKENSYLDGYAFHHHGISTFYKNYSKSKVWALTRNLSKAGLSVQADLSKFRQVCLISSLQ